MHSIGEKETVSALNLLTVCAVIPFAFLVPTFAFASEFAFADLLP